MCWKQIFLNFAIYRLWSSVKFPFFTSQSILIIYISPVSLYLRQSTKCVVKARHWAGVIRDIMH